jgi:hypothetical protein
LTKPIWQRATWYYARLSAMSPPEILHRSLEAAAKQAARRLNHSWETVNPGGSLNSILNVATRALACPPEVAAVVGREADDIRAGRFHFLGAHWPKPSTMPFSPQFWHIDPDDGEQFPQWNAYCFDIPFRHAVNTREVKRIWELSRLQFIIPLALDAVIRKDRQSADLAVGLIQSWMKGNAPHRGPNWIFGIELALRVISVALTISIIGVEHLDVATQNWMLRFFVAHVDWIKRFPSLYSSANNHRIAELSGLVVGTTMAPQIPNAAAIHEDSWRALLVEIDRQIYPDGVGAEQSPGYAAFSIELFLIAALACGRDRSLPKTTADRLSAWAEYSLWLMDADGRIPTIGDFDDCRAIATTQTYESRYVASIVAVVASCVGRPDLAPPSKDPSIRDVIFQSTGTSSKVRIGMRSFPTGGYSVIRSANATPVGLIFDHGQIGYLSIAAHGHADTLSVWLSVRNQPLIVDAGTYLYHSSKVLRNTFRETAVHNTLTLDDTASSVPSGPFNWTRKANAYVTASASNSGARIIAEHDGYASQYGVRHRRTVEFDGVSCFRLIDELVGVPTNKTVAVSFLLDPTCHSSLERDCFSVLVTRNDIAVARLVSAGPLKARIAHGEEKTGRGWISPSFGLRVPTDQVLFEGKLKEPSIITIEIF